jgi:hypothetical protein
MPMMRFLTCDTNVVIDKEAGALMETLFRLTMQFGIHDSLYCQEIEPVNSVLGKLVLQIYDHGGYIDNHA